MKQNRYFLFTYITTTTVASFPKLQEKFHVGLVEMNWTVAIPALGLSIGPLLCASVADTIGRRPVLIVGTMIALLSTIGAVVTTTFPVYMIARFFQGLGVSPASNVGLAVINDLFCQHQRGQKVGLWILSINLGLLFGPLVGGIVNLAGADWVQWLCAILFGFVLLSQVCFLPETLYPRHLMLSRQVAPNFVMEMEINGGASVQQCISADCTGLPANPRRTKDVAFFNFRPLPGLQHPSPFEDLVRFVKLFQHFIVPMSICSYSFFYYWWVMSVVTLIPVAYKNTSTHIQG